MPQTTDNKNRPPSGVRMPGSRRFFFRARGGPDNNGGWYYQAREGILGPFITYELAERDLARRMSGRSLGHSVQQFLRLLINR